MNRAQLPLNNLRAFEAAARHGSFTHAAAELRVTPAALSHQVKGLEARLGFRLFRRVPRGLSLTDEGQSMLPVLKDCFDRITQLLVRVHPKAPREIFSLGVGGTFAVSWLIPRFGRFEALHPGVDVRMVVSDDRADQPYEGFDVVIRFGDGPWPGLHSDLLFKSAVTPVCAPALAPRLVAPGDLANERLLRCGPDDDWRNWFAGAGEPLPVLRGPVFSSIKLMVDAAETGLGVALVSPLFVREQLASGRLVQPFSLCVDNGAYYVTRLGPRAPSAAVVAFTQWLLEESASGRGADGNESGGGQKGEPPVSGL